MSLHQIDALACPKRALRRKCAEVFGVDEARMIGGNRRRELIVPRQATCYILRKRFPGLSLPRIGVLMGGRDHSTICHAIAATEERMARDPVLAEQIHTLIACPNGDARYFDAHVRQWTVFQATREQIVRREMAHAAFAGFRLVPPAPASVSPIFADEELADFIDPAKVFCGQCDRAVLPGEAARCSQRLCPSASSSAAVGQQICSIKVAA